MAELFHVAAGLLPQADLEIKQTLKQNRMKSKKAKTRKHFFSLKFLRLLRKQTLVFRFNYYKNNNLENI